jgi:threonine dehydrogenase-like Zn-dependent dehydrogenase
MRAAVAVDGEILVEEVEDPVPERGQVLVASLANGICGSDLHLLERQRQGEPTVAGVRIVPGHEFCAEILDHGPGADDDTRRRWPIGARVCANPFVDSGVLVGGSPAHSGGLGELMALDVRQLLRVPDHVDPERAALTEPLAVGIHAVAATRRRANRGPFVVLGCGPIGLAVILALRAEGRGPIVASDPSPARLALATRVGADVVVAPDDESPFSHLAALGGRELAASVMLDDGTPDGPVVFECVGRAGMLASTIAAVPRHSHVVVVGVCLEREPLVPGLAIVRELAMDFVLAYLPSELEESLRRLATDVVDASPIVTATVELDAAAAGFDALRRGDEAKVLVLPQTRT